MGPIKSRPFTFALHSLVGIGFLGGTFLVRPFLPNDEKNEDNSDKIICDAKANQSNDDNEEITKHVKKQPPCSCLHNFFLKVKCEHNIEAKDLREKCHMGAN